MVWTVDYSEFRDIIRKALPIEPSGLTWPEIREKGGLPQKVPNNRWVRRLEEDINLRRSRVADRGTVWKLDEPGSSG